jgi:predicted RNA-binding Zn-ribbon protein involved in translation (DUF1610 family)
MKTQIAPMTCAACGVTMNPHAEKPVEPISADEAERADQNPDGLIEEIHQCPRCGDVRSRRVL